jgi:hypothetical protein
MDTQTQEAPRSAANDARFESYLRNHRIEILVNTLSGMGYRNPKYLSLDNELRELLAERAAIIKASV